MSWRVAMTLSFSDVLLPNETKSADETPMFQSLGFFPAKVPAKFNNSPSTH